MPKSLVVRSMTGYGEATATVDGTHYFVEIRSLNNKYFKSTIRLPDSVQGLEAEIESRLRERLSRGTITLNARCTDSSAQAAYQINTGALNSYIQQLRTLPEFGGNAKVDLAALLNLPGVLQPPSDEEARFEAARAAIMPLVDRACEQLTQMREREGRALVDDLRSNLAYIADRLKLIQERAPGVVADYEQRLQSRIENLLREAEASVEPGDLIREIAAYAERTDIAEEIKRLSTHLTQFEELLAGANGKPVGRTLDFLAQEMLREANTIASKSPDAFISRNTVEIKGSIDRLKEQVQNIE